MINKVQATNYNPAFNANVHITSNALNFFTNTKSMTKDALLEQKKALKELGSDKLAITIDHDVATNSLTTKIDKLVNDKVFSGETRVAFYKPDDSFDLIKMVLYTLSNAKPDDTKNPEMFDFMA